MGSKAHFDYNRNTLMKYNTFQLNYNNKSY